MAKYFRMYNNKNVFKKRLFYSYLMILDNSVKNKFNIVFNFSTINGNTNTNITLL